MEPDGSRSIESLVTEHASDIIWTVHLDNQVDYISPSITRILGYTVEEALATNRLIIV